MAETKSVKHIGFVVVLVGALVALVWTLQRSLIYLPSGGPVPPARGIIEGARDVTLTTSDGLRLRAWFVPAASSGDGSTVLVANGNAGDRSTRAPLAKALAAEGLSVLLFDYRGYGGNPGTPSEEGLARDARAAYEFLVAEGIPTKRLFYFGESLGAAVAARLATERPPAGLILRSPFTDLAAVGQVHYPFLPVRALLRDRFPVSEHVRGVGVPTLVIWGTRDSIVPPDQSRAVARAAGATTVEVEGAGHNDLVLLEGDELIDAIVGFVDRVRAQAE